MNIPQITGIDTAIKIYYLYPEIGNNEIRQLFGRHSSATTAKFKRAVKEEMIKRNEMSYGLNKVKTCTAFDVWGIDVADLERRRKKLQALELQ